MKRSFQMILALAMIVVLTLPAAAQDAEKKKKKRKKGDRSNQAVAALMKKLENAGLSEEQLGKIKVAGKEFTPKFAALAAKRREAIGPDAFKAMAAARKAATDAGKKGKELQEATLGALSEEQREKFVALQKEQQALTSALRQKVAAIVGPEKAKELKLTRGGKAKGKGKGKKKKKADN